jgi:ankyrin repeat protein
MWAALRGQKGTFKLLNKNNNIQKYINLKDKNGMTALMFAAWKGNVDNVKFLIDNGADIDAQDNDGETALITACNFGKTDVIKTLISNKVNANLIDKNGWTALKWAHEQTNSNLINLLTN